MASWALHLDAISESSHSFTIGRNTIEQVRSKAQNKSWASKLPIAECRFCSQPREQERSMKMGCGTETKGSEIIRMGQFCHFQMSTYILAVLMTPSTRHCPKYPLPFAQMPCFIMNASSKTSVADYLTVAADQAHGNYGKLISLIIECDARRNSHRPKVIKRSVILAQHLVIFFPANVRFSIPQACAYPMSGRRDVL